MHILTIYRAGTFFLELRSPVGYVVTNWASQVLQTNRIIFAEALGQGSVSLLDYPGNVSFTYEVAV